MKYRVRAAAARDLDEAAEWYRANAFPAYSIFYRVVDDVVVITAAFHGRRLPSQWKRRR